MPWHYDNSEVFYSPASISLFLRSAKNGKAYWFGNITGPETYGSAPRYPLVMGEVDEETGFLKKDSYTVISSRGRRLTAPPHTTFYLLDDRETMNIELYVTRFGANREDFWRSNAYKYIIEVKE